MKKIITLILLLGGMGMARAQNVGIGTTSPGAKLDVSSTTSGVLIPRVALTATDSASPVASPATSTLVYNTATAGSGAVAVIPGFYYWNGTAWVRVLDTGSIGMATSVSNTSSANTISTTVNSVTGTGVNVINSHTVGWTQAGGLSDTVNGVRANVTPASGTVANIIGYNASGAPVYTSAAAVLSGNTTVSNTSTSNTLSTTVNGVTGAGVNIINSHATGWTQAGGLSDTVNGVRTNVTPASGTIANVLGYNSSGAPVYQAIAGIAESVSNTVNNAGNTISTTVDGTTGAAVTVPNIYSTNGTLASARTVTMGADNLTFSSSTGNLIFSPTSTGGIGIGTATVPKGAIGSARLAMDGANASTSGPHVQYTTAADNYPVFQQLNYSHDNVALSFDGYYDGTWRSGTTTGGSFQLYKVSGGLQFNYSSVNTQGTAAAYTTGMYMNNAGNVAIDNGAGVDANSWLYVFRPGTNYGAAKAGVGVYRTGSSTAANGGTGWSYSGVDAGVKAYSFWGNNYSAGIAGDNYGDYATSAAVVGYMDISGYFGALGYKDASSTLWGAYSSGPSNVTFAGDNAFLQLNTTDAGDKRARIDFAQSGTNYMEIGSDYLMNNTSDLYIYNRATNKTAAYFNPGSNVWLSARNTNSDLYLNASGYVGIGTTSPTVPLQIGSSVNINQGSYTYYANGSNAATSGTFCTCVNGMTGLVGNSSCGSCPVSLYASGRIEGAEFDANSDQRIKKDFSPTNVADDIETLNKIQVTNFRYKDELENGGGYKKGFIAQQVQRVFPQAVSTHTDFITDVFAMPEASMVDKGTLTVTMKTVHGFCDGDLVRLISPDGKQELPVTVKDEYTFAVNNWPYTSGTVFVYGKQADDFLAVDYDRVYTLGISAIQLLSRKLEESDARIQQLEKENSSLQSSTTDQAELMKNMKAQLNVINDRLNIRSEQK